MEITQRDRDSLRQTQHKLHSSDPFKVGNIVEHKIQDPSTYKSKSREEQGLDGDAQPSMPSVNYKSKYLEDNSNQQQNNQQDLHQDAPITNGNSSTTMPTVNERDELEQLDLPITPEDVQANYWQNMDRIEFEKLEWMSQKAERDYDEKLKASVHFDCDGKAVTALSKSEIDDKTPLQVHDIASLVKLLDSSFQPQVTYALNVISRIATRATLGMYDAVFDESIHQVLLKECLLRVRHHIDSPNETICQCALKCMRSLICNTQIDEIFLDKLSPVICDDYNPNFWLNFNQDNFDIDMKDNECVFEDAILGLIARTDILARFKYLLNTKNDSKFIRAYQDCILDLLIRIARHSQDVCWILNNNEFPSIVIEIFLPSDIVLKDHIAQSLALRALKFIRIIAQGAKEFNQPSESYDHNAPCIKLPLSITRVINTYYHLDCYQADSDSSGNNEVLFRIQIETLSLMKCLSMLAGFSAHVFSALTMDQSTLVRQVRTITELDALKPIKSPSSLDWQYAAALMGLLGRMMNHERFNSAKQFVQPLWANFIRIQTLRWFNDLVRDRYIPHQDVSLALFLAANIFFNSRDELAIADFYSVLLGHLSKFEVPSKHVNLIYFKHLVDEATYGSHLKTFQKTDGRLRDPVMLPSYGFMLYNTSQQCSYQLSNILDRNTPHILLNLYFTVLRKSTSKFKIVLPHYVDNLHLNRFLRLSSCYLEQSISYESRIQKSILGQLEVRILSNASLLSAEYYVQSSAETLTELIDEPKVGSDSYSQLILNILSIVGLINPDVEYLFETKDLLLEKVILDENLYLKTLEHITMTDDFKDLAFNKFNLFDVYNETKETNVIDSTNLLVLKSVYLSCEQPGRFWVFQPLIEYYRSQIHNCDATKRVKDGKWFLHSINKRSYNRMLPADCRDADVISLMLKLNIILMYQSAAYFQNFVKQNIEEYLCLIGSIFLDDDLFLNAKVSRLVCHNLELILIHGLKDGVKSLFGDANRKILTLNLPLIDFFNKIVDQFEAASYNDIVFSNFLLLFLSTGSDKVFKRKLFSDKLETCLASMRIPSSSVWIPKEFLLTKKETDQELKLLIKLSRPQILRSSYLDQYTRFHGF